jgi:hypothetical protein
MPLDLDDDEGRPWPSYCATRSSVTASRCHRIKRLRGFLAKPGVGSAPAVPYTRRRHRPTRTVRITAERHRDFVKVCCAGSLHALDGWTHVRRELTGDGTLCLAALLPGLPPIARIAEPHALRFLRREGRAGPV